MSFDKDFEAAFAFAFANSFGEPMDYAGPGGSPTVSAVPVVYNEDHEALDAGEYGAMRAPKKTGRAFRQAFVDAGVTPVKGGTFTRASGAVLTLAQAPEGPDSAGEYRFDFGA
jgi:hypothetical protein